MVGAWVVKEMGLNEKIEATVFTDETEIQKASPLKVLSPPLKYTDDEVTLTSANDARIDLKNIRFRVELNHIGVIHADGRSDAIHGKKLIVRAMNRPETFHLAIGLPAKDIGVISAQFFNDIRAGVTERRVMHFRAKKRAV
jgi:hypothetical protein